jgi:hypothetical protein
MTDDDHNVDLAQILDGGETSVATRPAFGEELR